MNKNQIEEFVEKLTDEEMGFLHDVLMEEVPGTEGGIPKHPDFVYRLSGEWKGWDDWLGVSRDHEA